MTDDLQFQKPGANRINLKFLKVMSKFTTQSSENNEDFDFNLDLQKPRLQQADQLNWLQLIPKLKSIDDESCHKLTISLEKFCNVLADLQFIDRINSVFENPNSTDYEIK